MILAFDTGLADRNGPEVVAAHEDECEADHGSKDVDEHERHSGDMVWPVLVKGES
jgi:hypothetical protein